MVSIRDVLKRPIFHNASLVAGAAGTDRSVQWVHIGEIPHLGDFLQGGELVLTTGVGLTSPPARTRFLLGLIEANAAGLVIELGTYFSTVPEDIIALGDRHHFPVIAFPHAVRFLDVSQDINSLVISQHHRILDDLEALSLRLRQALLNTEGPASIVQSLYETVGNPVVFRPRDDFDPAIMFGEWPVCPGPFEDIALHPTPVNHPVPGLRQTILVFGQPMGDLVAALPGDAVDERLYLAIDRTTASLAQDLIRTENLERTRRREDAALLEHLLFEEQPPPSLIKRFQSRYNLNYDQAYRVIVIDHSPDERSHRLRRQLSALLTIVGLEQTDRVVLVAIGRTPLVTALPQTLTPILRKIPEGIVPVGLSSPHVDPADLRDAFAEAYDAVLVARYRGPATAHAYENLGLFRWILATNRNDLERLLVIPELGSLLQRPDASALLATLEALLTHVDSKLAASAALGIHRQTLYARIRTLSHVLGDDFLQPERRLALAAALMAYRYLTTSDGPFVS